MIEKLSDQMTALSLAEVVAGRKPLRRTLFGGCALAAQDSTDVVVTMGRRGIDPAVLPLIAQHFAATSEPVRIVVASTGELNALMGAFRRAGDHDLAHLLAATGSFAASSRLVVMTTALRQAFWMPSGAPDTFAAWRAMFGLDAAMTDADAIGALLPLVDPQRPVIAPTEVGAKKVRTGLDLWLDAMTRIELNSLTQVQWARSTGSAADQYRRSCVIKEQWSVAQSVDPIARAEALENGSAISVNVPKAARGSAFSAALADADTPCKLKSGTAVRLFAGPTDPSVNAQLTSVDFENDRLVVTIAPVRGAGPAMEAMPETVVVAARPFNGGGRVNPTNRWGTKWSNGAAPAPLSMPTDLLVAGAPTR